MACCCTTSLSVFRLDILSSSGYGVSRTLGGGRTFLVTLRDGAGVAILPDAVCDTSKRAKASIDGSVRSQEGTFCKHDRTRQQDVVANISNPSRRNAAVVCTGALAVVFFEGRYPDHSSFILLTFYSASTALVFDGSRTARLPPGSLQFRASRLCIYASHSRQCLLVAGSSF